MSTANQQSQEVAGRLLSVLPRLQHALKRDRLRLSAADPLAGILSERRGQYRLMHTLLDHGRATTAQLAARLDVAAPTISTMVHALDEHGLIVRERDNDDQRVVWISLSPAGHSAVEEERQRWRAVFLRRFDRLSDADQAAIAEAVPAIERLLGTVGCAGTNKDT